MSTGATHNASRFILASGSPRRRELLTDAGFIFDVVPADIDESQYPPNATPTDIAEFLAAGKAQVVAARWPDAIVLGADTVVALHGQPLGKSADEREARAMLTALSGTDHFAITGVAVVHLAARFSRSIRVESAVHMRPLSPDEIEAYVASGQWRGKAGGYGIQDADPFVTRISGSLSNVVGLPVDETTALLASAGVKPARPG